MLFSIRATDRADAGDLRQQVRPTHLDYLTGLGARLVLAGPRLSPDGSRPIGSLLIIEAADRAAVEAIAAGDPYAMAGLFSTVEIEPFRLAFLNPPVA